MPTAALCLLLQLCGESAPHSICSTMNWRVPLLILCHRICYAYIIDRLCQMVHFAIAPMAQECYSESGYLLVVQRLKRCGKQCRWGPYVTLSPQLVQVLRDSLIVFVGQLPWEVIVSRSTSRRDVRRRWAPGTLNACRVKALQLTVAVGVTPGVARHHPTIDQMDGKRCSLRRFPCLRPCSWLSMKLQDTIASRGSNTSAHQSTPRCWSTTRHIQIRGHAISAHSPTTSTLLA